MAQRRIPVPISIEGCSDVQNDFRVTYSDGSVSVFTISWEDDSCTRLTIEDQVSIADSPGEGMDLPTAEELIAQNRQVLAMFCAL
jgi:hypothetical protein